MSAQSPELQMKIQEWRAKARDNLLTQEEMREAIAALRKDRGSVPQATAGSRTTAARKTAAKKASISGDDLLAELEGL